MRILVTGANGFIGKNLISGLNNRGYQEIYKVTRDTKKEDFERYTKNCDFVFHLAGINRTKEEKEFTEGNVDFISILLGLLEKHNNNAPILMTSSIQAEKDNPYGKSKEAAEELLFKYSKDMETGVFIYRLTNLFGKWGRPDYNSVVATFCHNISRDMDIQINDPDTNLKLSYIDDVVNEFINAMNGLGSKDGRFYKVPISYNIKIKDLGYLIRSFKDSRNNLFLPDMGDEFTKKLYSTYLSYLPEDSFAYDLKMNVDNRGSFTEFLKTEERGQVSINISKAGIIKGNHWHHTKNEKFLVISGEGIIKFRKIDSDKILEYRVSGEKLEVVDIPTGYTHCIVNIGDVDLVTVMWANEIFDPENPDTYFLEVGSS